MPNLELHAGFTPPREIALLLTMWHIIHFVLSADHPASATLHLPPFMGCRARSALLLSEWFGFTCHHPHLLLLLSGYPASLMPEKIWYIYVVERILPLAGATSYATCSCPFLGVMGLAKKEGL